MTDYTHTLTVIVPIAQVAAARALALHYDPDPASDGGFKNEYSADGSAPATHSVAHTACTQTLVDDLTAAQGGNPPQALLDSLGVTAQQFADLLASFTIAIDSDPHAVIAAAGLQPVVEAA